MAKHKPGLKKGLSAILEGARISKETLAHQPPEAISAAIPNDTHPKSPTTSEQITLTTEPQPADRAPLNASQPKQSRLGGIFRAFKQIPRRIFRPGATPSDKRRMSISKHLLY